MGKAEKTEKANKKQKHFWKDFKAELKKVIWPTSSQVVNNTIIVIVIVVIVTAIVFVLDLAFESINTYGIDKLKGMVQNTVSTNETNTDSNSEENNETNTNNEAEANTENNENTNNETPNDTANEEQVSE